jgi:hypothetical protein
MASAIKLPRAFRIPEERRVFLNPELLLLFLLDLFMTLIGCHWWTPEAVAWVTEKIAEIAFL